MQESKPFKKSNMESKRRNIGTTSGASEPQRSAGASGSGVKTGSSVGGSLRSSSSNREGAGVASQAPAILSTTSAEDDDDVGPFSSCDDVERLGMKITKIASALKTFCTENRNVHQPIKKWATEMVELCGKFDPKLRKLRRGIAAIDRELS